MISADQSTKQFLARVVAWPQDGEPTAYVNVHNTFVPQDSSTVRTDKSGKPIYPWSGKPFQTLADAVNFVAFANTKPTYRDLYFCTSTQRFAEDKVSAKGQKFKKAIRSADNAVKMKAIFLDSDLKDYADKKEWMAAFTTFLKDSGMPRPTVMVFSGGGFHLYWTLMDALTVDEWMPLAYSLAEATKRHGFKCDTQCTIDPARILRIPGTLNHKYDPPVQVTLLGNPLDFDYVNSKLEAILAPYKVAVPYSMLNNAMTVLPPRTPIQGGSDLSSGIDMSAMAPVKLDDLLPVCGFLNEAVTMGGSTLSNPLWNLTTLISVFTEGGRADAHRMADQHPGYGPGEQDELFDRKVEERTKKNLGWPRCATISASGCTHCATCPLMALNKSPLNHAPKAAHSQAQTVGGFSQAAAATIASVPQTAQAGILGPGTSTQDPDLPPGYLRNPQGQIMRPETDDTGVTTWYPIIRYPMVAPFLQKDPWTLNFTTETEFGKTCQISVPMQNVGTAEMRKEMQAQGFMIMGGARGFNTLADFMMAWITQLQSMKDSVVNTSPFGWVTSKGKTNGFVFGGTTFTPNGTEVATPSDPELARQFSPTGDRQPWIDAANMITNQKRPQLDAILASAFAAPLVRFTGHAGLLMSAYSVESGIGKSTALKVAQAVWGDPVKAVQSLSDTQNSVLNKMGELRSLPMYWDELKSDDDAKKFVDTVFRLTLGKEKSRMTARVTQRSVGSWETMLVSASNESLLDNIQYKTRTTTAGLYRVFEYTVPPAPAKSAGQIDPTIAQRMVSKLHDNFGQIGVEYAAYLGGNVAQVERDVGAMSATVSKEVNMNPDERFWVSVISTILLGAKYANQLGFAKIDEMRLKAFMYLTLRDMRSTRSASTVDMRDATNVTNMIGRFLNESRARHTLVTNHIYKGKGKPPVGSIVAFVNDRLEAIHVHIGKEDHMLRIGQSYFQDWLTKNNYPRHVIMEAVKKELGAHVLNARLGAGTPHANASEFILEIDLKNGNPLMNFIDEA